MITPAGHPKVLDFGLARPAAVPVNLEDLSTSDPTAELTAPGGPIGTVAYMSPEQIRGEELDTQSDIFSFGIILYQLATGRHPFIGPTQMATASAILNEPPGGTTEPDTLSASLPLRQVVIRALTKEKQERYSSAAEVAGDLHQLVRGEPLASVLTAPPRRALRFAMLAGVVLLAVTALTLGGFALLKTPPARSEPRISVAVVPLADRTGESDGAVRSVMVADLLATDLAASRLVRAVGPDQTGPLLSGLPEGASGAEIASHLAHVMNADYVFTGSLYREEDRYIATLEPTAADGVREMPPIRAEATSAAGLAERLATGLRQSLPEVSRLTAWRDDRESVAALTSESEEANMLFERGRTAWRDGRLGEAIDWLEKATDADPSSARAHSLLAAVLHDAGYGGRAREAASRAVALLPRATTPGAQRQALEIRATWAQVHGRTDEQVDLTRQMAALYPDDTDTLLLQASALRAAGRLPAAVEVLRRARAIEPARPRPHLEAARLLVLTGEYDEAAVELSEAERLYRLVASPEGLGSTHEARGQLLKRRERYAEAATALRAAHSSFEQTGREALAADARRLLANVELLLGNAGISDKILADVAETARQAGNLGLLCRVRSSQGAQQYLRGDYAPAEAALREAIDLARLLENRPLILDPLSNLGSLLVYTGNLQEGREAVEEALAVARELDQTGRLANARQLLAEIAYREGETGEAIRLYGEIAEAPAGEVPESEAAWAWLGLAEAYQTLGRLDEALQASDSCVSAYRSLGVTGYLGYALVRRAELLAELGRPDEANRDLAEAERIARSPESGMEDLLVRYELGRAFVEASLARWRGARAAAARAAALPGATAPTTGALLRSMNCAIDLRSGGQLRAAKSCRDAMDDSGGWAPAQTIAQAGLAHALLEAGRPGDALAHAREALTDARKMEIWPATARAAAVLVSLPEAHRPPESRDLAREGLGALEAYVGAAPETDRPRVRSRRDVSRLFSMLEPAARAPGPASPPAGGAG
jgi:tetratricopeptide (TPR) repeat protein